VGRYHHPVGKEIRHGGAHDVWHIVQAPPAPATDGLHRGGVCGAVSEAVQHFSPGRSLTDRVAAILNDSEAVRRLEVRGGPRRCGETTADAIRMARELARSAALLLCSTFLRESRGRERGSAYSGVRLLGATPILTALNQALADAQQSKTGCGSLGGKVLATAATVSTVNGAHQDQSAH
jgi:hypothetical protein